MAEVKFDGTFFHCSQCGAFATRREEVRCDCLTGRKVGADGPALVLRDEPLPPGTIWHQYQERIWREYEDRWRARKAEERRQLQADAAQAIHRRVAFSVCPYLPVVR